jgi:hypothetical protein
MPKPYEEEEYYGNEDAARIFKAPKKKPTPGEQLADQGGFLPDPELEDLSNPVDYFAMAMDPEMRRVYDQDTADNIDFDEAVRTGNLQEGVKIRQREKGTGQEGKEKPYWETPDTNNPLDWLQFAYENHPVGYLDRAGEQIFEGISGVVPGIAGQVLGFAGAMAVPGNEAKDLQRGAEVLQQINKAKRQLSPNSILRSWINGKFIRNRNHNLEVEIAGIGKVDNVDDLNQLAASPHRMSGSPDQGTLFNIEDYVGPLDPASKAAAVRFNELIATKSGYASMAEFKRTVLNRWPERYQTQLFRELWENRQYEGYIEHLIQKADHMDWYWNMKGKNRNAVENVRILFNDRVKNMKDTIEKIVHGYTDRSGTFIPGKGWQSPNLANRLIVSFEDPQKRFKTFRRQNPGDVIIMRAGNDKIIGNLGQYLDVLYPQDALGKQLLQRGSREAGFSNVAAFRNKILSDRIDIIIRDSATIPSNRTAAKRYIKDNIDTDMVNLITQYPFLQPPPAIRQQMITDGLLQGTTRVD